MPRYNANPPVFYNSGVRYGDAASPLKKPKQMAKIARTMSKLPIKQRSEKFGVIIKGIEDNPTIVTEPKPTLVELKAAQAKSVASIKKVDDLEIELAAARAEMHADIDAVAGLVDQEISTVESATGGDKAQILTIGYDVQDEEPVGSREVRKPERFSVTAGDNDGELDHGCDRIPYARMFETETTETPDIPSSWKKNTPTTKSSSTTTGLPSGKRVYVRTRGLGPNGPGPWSDVISKIVP